MVVGGIELKLVGFTHLGVFLQNLMFFIGFSIFEPAIYHNANYTE